jgi:CHAT domain-containing protein
MPAVAVVAALGLSGWRDEKADPLEQLSLASFAGNRVIQARLSGFSWAPLRKNRGSSGDAFSDRIKLMSAASGVFERAATAPSATTLHAAALAYVVAGDPQRGRAALQALGGGETDASVSSDLAAVEMIIAEKDDDSSRLAAALVAADAALRIEPERVEARFNRALVLEALGLRDQARSEWRSYLRLDPGGDWANEAREHERKLTAVESFQQLFAHSHDQILASPSAVSPLARRDRQGARVAGEEQILGAWGDAILAGRDAEAAQQLALARAIGATLAADGGDAMLPSLVEAIDSAGAQQRLLLAKAHRNFREGRRLYGLRQLKNAERALSSAADEFSQAGSPGELMARAFAANTIHEQGRIAEESERLRLVLEKTPARFPALRAQVLWQQGGVTLVHGQWGDCIAILTESLSLFERLGERNYAATVRRLLAYVYDHIGQSPLAWKHRMIVLQELGRQPSFRLREELDSVASAALADENWPVALSFLGLEIDLSQYIDSSGHQPDGKPDTRLPLAHIGALLHRAEVNVHIGRQAAATADVGEAKRMIEGLHEAADRDHLDANRKAVQASLEANPAAAAALLSDAIAFHSSAGLRMRLPPLLMSRGRAYRDMGDPTRAGQDFEAGIKELERNRESLPEGEDRWGVFHAAYDLFGDAIILALDRGDPSEAFQYVERARARALLDTLGSPWPHVEASDVPTGTVVVEYAVTSNALVIFVLDRSGVHAVRQAIDRKALLADIAAFGEAVAKTDDVRFRRLSHSLYRRLIDPVRESLVGNTTVAIVPDPSLCRIPFAALVDADGSYLIQRYAITMEPSGAVFARLHKPRSAQPQRKVLVVSGAEDLGRLAGSDREAEAVAASYPSARRLLRQAATPAVFQSEVASADVVHFTGHAVASSGETRPGYLLLKSGPAANGRLEVKQIAAMHFPRTSLVVLAACATAAGEIRSNEGTISLARAFLAAGVPTVVATLRPIDDEAAAEFFAALHRRLARGLTPAEALRETQIEWIGKSSRASLWNSVVVIGE